MIKCPFCGKLTDPKLDNCVHCGGILEKAARSRGGVPQAASQTCPNCGALVKEGDIICVACGTNLLTGQRIAHERPLTPAARRESPWKAIVIGIAVLVVVILGGLAAVVLLRDPVARAQKLFDAGRLSEAGEILAPYVADNPDAADAQFLLGRVRLASKDYSTAANAFDAAARSDENNEEALMLQALSLAKLEGESNRNLVVATLSKLVERDEERAEAWRLLGVAEGAGGNAPAQARALERAAALEPNDAEIHTQLAVAHMLAGDLMAARRDLAVAQSLGASGPAYEVASGVVASIEGDIAAASARIEQAAQRPAGVPKEILLDLGLLLLSKNQYEEAHATLQDVLSQDPQNRQARFFQAVSLNQQRMFSEALPIFQELSQAGDLAPEAALEASKIHLQQNEVEEALEAIERAIRNGGVGPEFRTVRGRIYAERGEYDFAQEEFRGAIVSDPGYAPAYLESGLAHVQQGAVGEGIRQLRRYLELADATLPGNRITEVEQLIEQLGELPAEGQDTAGVASAAS